MFTQQDLTSLKRVKNQYMDKKSQESESSSACEQKSQDELYIRKYFLNNSFKILHIDIIGTQQVSISVSRTDSYMIYIIKVMTEDYSYQVRRRYSEFLKLYQSIIGYQTIRGKSQRTIQYQKSTVQNRSRTEYLFPTKKISCSLRHFFNIVNKEKLAQQRKLQLCSFLNQINNNYIKCPDEHTEDYIELLKFIDMKQQHKKYWTRKQGRILQISNIGLKDSNLLNQIKPQQKQSQATNSQNPAQINIDHLTQCLQHQISKINLAVIVKQPVNPLNNRLSSMGNTADLSSDPMITDQIIKNIVLQMKRKINYDHIRCILKGKDVKHTNTSSNILSPSKQSKNNIKKGLIQVALKHGSNQLVSIHILKIILYVFLNSECNYSSQAFFKTLSEIDINSFVLSQDKQQLAICNKQFREIYFKLVKQYMMSKEQYGVDRKSFGEKCSLGKMMCLMLNTMYDKWNQNYQKNKEFKLKDDQKQWTMVIQNLPQAYNVRKSSRALDIHIGRQYRKDTENLRSSIQILNQRSKQKKQNKAQQIIHSQLPTIPRQNIPEIKKYKSDKIQMTLKTYKQQQFYSYILKADIKNITYKECISIMKQQKNWNPLLIDTQLDSYSNTRKDLIIIPEKPEKMFRFVQRQQIQMILEDSDEIAIDGCQNFIPLGHQQEQTYENDQKNPKMSTQTMPSTSGSCAHEHQPEYDRKESVEGLASSKQAQKINFTKSPPREGNFNSYHQSLKIERKPRDKHNKFYIQSCLVEVDIQLTQPTAKKYFMSQIEGTTQFIWRGFIKAFEPQAVFNEVKASQ